MSRDRSDKEGKYYEGKYGPSLEAFFDVHMYFMLKYWIELDIKAIVKGFELVPAQYLFHKDIGGKGCNTFAT